MNTVSIKTTCRACQGEGWFKDNPFEMAGCNQQRLIPCPACRGTGKEIRFIDQQDLVNMQTAIKAEQHSA